MATLTTQPMPMSGLHLVEASAAGGGDRFTPGDRTFLMVHNTDSATHTVTLTTPNTVQGLAIADQGPFTVGIGETAYFPIPRDLYASSDGLGDVAYSAVTGMKVAVLAMP